MQDEISSPKIKLRLARLNHKLSLQSVAEQLGISPDLLEQYEYDSRQIPCDEALKLFRMYGISSKSVYLGIDA